MPTLAWIIGSRGLLGGATVRAVQRRDGWSLLPAEPLPWGDAPSLDDAVRRTFRRLHTSAAAAQARWCVVWAAGAAVMSTSRAVLDDELDEFRRVLGAIEDELGDAAADGSCFVASSAGVYGAAASPPFSERTPPDPGTDYGRFKVAVEHAATDFGRRTSLPVLIGRITNLYGPGQKLDKMQGLVSHLASSRYSDTPVLIFAPLETVRDYFFVDDCAELILDCMQRLEQDTSRPVLVKVMGSGQGLSIGTLLGHLRAITKFPPHVATGVSATGHPQALDLRVRSEVWPELDQREKTPFAAGFHATALDILRRIQR